MILPELLSAIQSLGVQQEDSICLFSDLSDFGIPEVLRDEVKTVGLDALCDSYISTFEAAIGPTGSLFMPAYTYSACRNEIFNHQETPSSVGFLTERFRTQPKTLRSFHPIFSFAGRGPLADEILRVDDYDCFGPLSFFGSFKRIGGKYVLFGVDLPGAATFLHHSLQRAGAPNRYFKEFEGLIVHKDQTVMQPVTYYVRNLGTTEDWRPLQELCEQRGLLRSASYSTGRILYATSDEIDAFAFEEFRKNPDAYWRNLA